MSDHKTNSKSDVSAKRAFIDHLLTVRGFDDARITRTPADITAQKSEQTYYFEIKYTSQVTNYFGAATLTEWESALASEAQYRFVIASKSGTEWMFQEYTPLEFMQYSYIPPFKIFFNIPVVREKSFVAMPKSKRVQMTMERMSEMVAIYKRFRPKLG